MAFSESPNCEVASKIKHWLDSLQDLGNCAISPFEIDPGLSPKDRVNNDFDRKIAVIYGDLEGKGGFTCENNDYFEGEFQGSILNRYGHFTKLSEDGCFTVGKWTNGLLDGIVDLELPNAEWRRACYRNGLKHGLERIFTGTYPSVKSLKRVAFYSNDSIVGPVWQCLVGGAHLVGKVDPETELVCGKDAVYIYPDLSTAIYGRFEDGLLVSGQMCKLDDANVDTETFMLTIAVSDHKYGPKIKRDVSTCSTVGKLPHQPDLWEASRVEVKMSGIAGPEAGQGLFTRVDIGEGEVVSFFNGVRRKSSRNNSNDQTSDQNYDYRIRLNGETDIDIPPHYASLDQYSATLGHKANHSFRPNAKWSRIEHPRFGLICAIKAIRPIPKGQEVLVNYGMGMADAPFWYKSLWVQHLHEKGLTEEEIRHWCCRQYAMNGRRIDLPF